MIFKPKFFNTSFGDLSNPTTYKQAKSKPKWINVMKFEYEALLGILLFYLLMQI